MRFVDKKEFHDHNPTQPSSLSEPRKLASSCETFPARRICAVPGSAQPSNPLLAKGGTVRSEVWTPVRGIYAQRLRRRADITGLVRIYFKCGHACRTLKDTAGLR